MGFPQSSYVGIDPSLTKTGFATVSSGGSYILTIRPKDERGVLRLKYYRDALREHLEFIVRRYGPIKRICIEDAAMHATNRADALGQLRGVLAVCAHDFCDAIQYVEPTRLKKYATGSGGADKEKLIQTALSETGRTLTDDEADAFWLAHLAWALSEDFPLKRHQMEVIHGIRNPKVKRRVSTRQTNNI